MHVNALGVTPASTLLLSTIYEALKAPSPSAIISPTGRSLRCRIGEQLRSIRNNTPGFPVAQHFNSAGHSITDFQVRGMRLCRGPNILRK